MALPTDKQLKFLRAIKEAPGLTLREYAEQFKVSHPTIMAWMEGLVSLGLAEEMDVPHAAYKERRLTERGVRFLRDVKKLEIAR